MEKLRIVVGGFIGLYPTGGVTWDYIQYPLGLLLMGHDVYYIEDTLQFPKYQKGGKNWDDASDSIAYLKGVMESFGMQGRWAYRDVASGKCYGIGLERVLEICRTADVFINVSASTFMRDEYRGIPKRVLIDSDPMFTQIEYGRQLALNVERSPDKMDSLVESHDYFFTFGENVGGVDCKVPAYGFNWQPTRQPVCLDYWRVDEGNKGLCFSTVMNWSVSPDLVYDNTTWGQKASEFTKIQALPALFPELDFTLMVSNLPSAKQNEVVAAGWRLQDPLLRISNTDDYRSFIAASAAEISVAKETYVKAVTGWFSCRSACYLAMGKPVITQETGWSKFIPTGEGAFAFCDLQSAAAAIEQVCCNPKYHSQKARELAAEYFDSSKVLENLLSRVNERQQPAVPKQAMDKRHPQLGNRI